MSPTYARLLTAVCALATTAYAVNPLEVNGKDFVDPKSNERFQIIGIDYQPGGSSGFTATSDPLSDPKACLRDAALMQRLGVNTIRVYNLSPQLDHSECASIFNAAGIYMILDVNSPLPNGALDRGQPWTTYDSDYLSQVFGIIEAFKNFPNLLGFFSGNEVINQDAAYMAPAYVRVCCLIPTVSLFYPPAEWMFVRIMCSVPGIGGSGAGRSAALLALESPREHPAEDNVAG